MTIRESDIQKACIDYLKFKGIFCYKINNGGVKKPNGSFIPAQTKGLPDLVIHYLGRVEYIEFKTPSGVMSEHQKAFRDQCIKDGINYMIIRSVAELEAYL
jgi:hypothetical protein